MSLREQKARGRRYRLWGAALAVINEGRTGVEGVLEEIDRKVKALQEEVGSAEKRVADVAASRRFYLAFGERAGFGLRDDTPERAQFAPHGGAGSFSVVAGDAPTEHVRMAFPGGDAGEQRDPDGNLAETV